MAGNRHYSDWQIQRAKLGKDTEDLNTTNNSLDLRDLCRNLHPKIDYTFFSKAVEHLQNWLWTRLQENSSKFQGVK